LLEAENEILAPSTDLQTLPQVVPGNITLENLSFCYPARPGILAVDNVSLTVKPGETLALVGPSGAGKSTLFDLLLRFFGLPTTLADQDIAKHMK
jgi:ATP-binding cassette subfamily B protein